MNPITGKGRTASTVEFVIGALFLLDGLTTIHWDVLTSIAYIAFGGFLIVCGLEWRSLRSLYGIYANTLSGGTVRTVSDLASATSSTPDETMLALKMMIKKGLATNLAIDDQSGKIIINSISAVDDGREPPEQLQAKQATPPSHPQTVSVSCQGCGAINQLAKGTSKECEHCGAPLSA